MLAALCGVLAASAIAADAPAPAGAERWALRPVRTPEPAPAPTPAPTPSPTLRGSKSIPLSDLPDERRTVRIVYQGYGPAGSVTPAR